MLLSGVLIFLAVLAYGLVHSFLASLWFKERLNAWLGDAASRWYRLVYNLFAVISLLPVLVLPAVLPDRRLYVIPSPWIYLSIAGQLLAVVALAVGLFQTGVWSFLGLRQLVGGEDRPSQMVVKGLYRYMRHPLYTAGLVFIWLVPVMTVNILCLNAGLSLYLVVGAYFEERKLKREFGEAYVRYQERTPMFIPWLI